MAPNGPSGPKTVLMGIIHDYMPWWTTLGPFRGPQGSLNGPNSTKMALLDPIWSCKSPKWPKQHQTPLLDPVKSPVVQLNSFGPIWAILGQAGPFWCCLGHLETPVGL